MRPVNKRKIPFVLITMFVVSGDVSAQQRKTSGLTIHQEKVRRSADSTLRGFAIALASSPAADSRQEVPTLGLSDFPISTDVSKGENDALNRPQQTAQRRQTLAAILPSKHELTVDTRINSGLKPAQETVVTDPTADVLPSNYRSENDFVHQFSWVAAGLAHHPLYFEDVNLERYGHRSCGQTAVSAIRFYWSAVTLPYRVGVDGPYECEYPRGFERPGNPTLPVREHLPFSLKGAAYQAAAMVGVGSLKH